MLNLLKYLKPTLTTLLTLSLALSISGMPRLLTASENYDHLIRSYPEAQKSQLKRAISFTTQKHPGKVISINQQTDNEEQYFKIKLLNTKGQLKTYHVNKAINKISP